jgi:hypothetical protein
MMLRIDEATLSPGDVDAEATQSVFRLPRAYGSMSTFEASKRWP